MVTKFLIKRIQKGKDNAKRRLTVLKFDELNVLNEIDRLYSGIDEYCETEFLWLYCERYKELWRYLKGEEPDEDILDELVEMYLAGLWNEPNEITHYAFEPELIRKRDRAKEAIVSVPTKVQKQVELDKHIRYAIQQIGFYTDIVSQEAELQAYKDAGVKKVKWNIYGDNRVCSDCHDLNGKIFDIDNIPDRPHVRCRCYLTPVT